MLFQIVVLNKQATMNSCFAKQVVVQKHRMVDFLQSHTVLSQLLLSWQKHATPSSSMPHGHNENESQGYSSSWTGCGGSPQCWRAKNSCNSFDWSSWDTIHWHNHCHQFLSDLHQACYSEAFLLQSTEMFDPKYLWAHLIYCIKNSNIVFRSRIQSSLLYFCWALCKFTL